MSMLVVSSSVTENISINFQVFRGHAHIVVEDEHVVPNLERIVILETIIIECR
mgnify:CR=1 FL=1